MIEFEVNFEFNENSEAEIIQDWKDKYNLPVLVFAQEAYQNNVFIGWHGDITEPKEMKEIIDLFNDEYFAWKSSNIIFYGSTTDINIKTQNVQNKKLYYPGRARIFIDCRS